MDNQTATISGGEKFLLERASEGDDAALKTLIERYLKVLFGFSLSFAPFGREQAFQITVASFAKTLRQCPRVPKDGVFLEALFREGLAECARTAPTGAPDCSPPLRIVREAVFHLSAGEKAVLLLRDQCRFSFEHIAAILGKDARESRSACLAARENLRAAVKEILEKPSGPNHVV